jgi:hypothetical protein
MKFLRNVINFKLSFTGRSAGHIQPKTRPISVSVDTAVAHFVVLDTKPTDGRTHDSDVAIPAKNAWKLNVSQVN